MKSMLCAVVLILLLQAGARGEDGAETAAPAPVGAAAAGPSRNEVSPWRLGAALGYGLRTNPLVQSEDIPIIVDLDISWFGEHFFFDNGDLGLTFADNEILTASLVGRFNSDRVFFGKTNTKFLSIGAVANAMQAEEPLRIAVPDRDYAGELGIELLTDGLWGRLQLSGFHDVSATHGGYELEADYAYGWRKQRIYVEPSVGLSYKSAELNDYYWGIRPGEGNSAFPGYAAGAGVNLFARLQFNYQVNRNWSFSFVGEVERLNDEAAESPIVDERYIYGFFAGFGYRFR